MFRPPSLTGWNVLRLCTFLSGKKIPLKIYAILLLLLFRRSSTAHKDQVCTMSVNDALCDSLRNACVSSTHALFLLVLIGICTAFFVTQPRFFLGKFKSFAVLIILFFSRNIREKSTLHLVSCYTCNRIVHCFNDSVTLLFTLFLARKQNPTNSTTYTCKLMHRHIHTQ